MNEDCSLRPVFHSIHFFFCQFRATSLGVSPITTGSGLPSSLTFIKPEKKPLSRVSHFLFSSQASVPALAPGERWIALDQSRCCASRSSRNGLGTERVDGEEGKKTTQDPPLSCHSCPSLRFFYFPALIRRSKTSMSSTRVFERANTNAVTK